MQTHKGKKTHITKIMNCHNRSIPSILPQQIGIVPLDMVYISQGSVNPQKSRRSLGDRHLDSETGSWQQYTMQTANGFQKWVPLATIPAARYQRRRKMASGGDLHRPKLPYGSTWRHCSTWYPRYKHLATIPAARYQRRRKMASGGDLHRFKLPITIFSVG